MKKRILVTVGIAAVVLAGIAAITQKNKGENYVTDVTESVES